MASSKYRVVFNNALDREDYRAPAGLHWYELRLTLHRSSLVTGQWTAFEGRGDVRAAANNRPRMAVVGRLQPVAPGGSVIALPSRSKPRAQLHLRAGLCTPFTSREQTHPPPFASSMALSAKSRCRWSLLRRSRRASILRRGGVALAMPVRPPCDCRADEGGGQ